MKIDLNMSDPLTLGLTLGIGHPVKERIRRITMRRTNKYMLGGTAMIIAAGLSLSSTSLASETSEPIKDAVKTVLDKAQVPAAPNLEMTPRSWPEAPAQAQPQAPKKLAEAPSLKPAAQSAAVTGLAPMRLRFHPRFTAEQLDKIQKQREAYAASEDDEILKTAMNDTFFRASFKNRFELTIDDFGVGNMEISLGQGGWPGYPLANTKWLKRDLSPDMKRGLIHIIERCSSESGPVYFNADVTDGDADLGKGTYEVGCVPGTKQVLENTSLMDLAYAYLNSTDLPVKTRQDNFQWKIRFAMMEEYVKNTPNATFEDDRAACVRMHTEAKNKHAFNDNHRKSGDFFLEKCHETDYNWTRKRLNLPEVQ